MSFIQGTDQLSDSAALLLQPFVDAMNDDPTLQVVVASHTRTMLEPNASLLLSRRRTLAVIRYLARAGIGAERLQPQAYGDTQPLGSTADNPLNERIEILLR